MAIVVAYYDIKRWKQEKWFSSPVQSRNKPERLPLKNRPFLERSARLLLDGLCDLQLATGTAMVIAALTQIRTISYYHQQFVLNYWGLTLTSFWAAREAYTKDRSAKDRFTNYEVHLDRLRALVRVMAIIVNCVLSLLFQGIVLIRETKHWDYSNGDKCYRLGDYSGLAAAQFWIAGVSLFTFTQLLCFIPRINDLIERLSSKRYGFYSANERWWEEAKEWKCPRSRIQGLSEIVKLVLSALLRILVWFSIQILSLWTYGEGFYPLEVLIYVVVSIWSTADIIDLKRKNADLLSGPETTWAFGQVLSIVLLGVIIFNTIDAIKGKVLLNHKMFVTQY